MQMFRELIYDYSQLAISFALRVCMFGRTQNVHWILHVSFGVGAIDLAVACFQSNLSLCSNHSKCNWCSIRSKRGPVEQPWIWNNRKLSRGCLWMVARRSGAWWSFHSWRSFLLPYKWMLMAVKSIQLKIVFLFFVAILIVCAFKMNTNRS